MKKYCEILAESSEQSQRHEPKLLGQEIEQETKQAEFIGINKAANSIENNAVEEMNLTRNILFTHNENSSCRGGKFQQLEARDENPKSSYYTQIGQNKGTSTVLSSSKMSDSHNTAPFTIICGKVFTNNPSEEFRFPYKEKVMHLKESEEKVVETSQPIDSLHLVTEYLSQVSLSSSSPKQRKRKKRKALSLSASYESWSENKKRCNSWMSPLCVGQACCKMSAEASMGTECLSTTNNSLNNHNSVAHMGIHCEKEFGESSTSSPSDTETIAKCLLETGSFGDSFIYPYSEAPENLTNILLLQEVSVNNADFLENDADMHMNPENVYEAGNLLKNELAVWCHLDGRNPEEYGIGMDVNKSCILQSKTETNAQDLGYNDSECFGTSPSKCSFINALKSNNLEKEQSTCERNLQVVVGHPGNLRVSDEEDFITGNVTLDNLYKCEENTSHKRKSVNGNHLCSLKNRIVHNPTVGLDGAALRKDKITLESCDNECHKKAEVQPTDHMSCTSFPKALDENSLLSSLEKLTEATICDQSPLKTSSPNNTCDSDDEDVLFIYASSWTELDTDIEQENYKDCKQKKSDKDDAINSTSVNENDQMKTIGMCLKMPMKRSEYGQKIIPNINDNSCVTYEASNGEFCERNSDIADGESFHDVGFNKDLWHLFDSRKYSRKDRVSQSLYRETETSDKVDFGDSSSQKIHFSERSCDMEVLLGKSVENCVKIPVLDRKGNGVKVDRDSKIAASVQHRENNIGLSRGSTFSRKVKKTENYLSLLNSLQELNLTENVGYQKEEEEFISGKEVKEKHISVDEIYSKKGSKIFEINFILPDSEPRISHLHTLKEVRRLVPKPKLPVYSKYRYCLTFIYQGVCLQPACPYHHEMCLELENYLSLLILHYATHQQEHQAWTLIDSHTANSHYAPLLAVSLLIPLARFFLVLDKHHKLSVIEVPSYLTSPLVVAKVRVLCEAHRGYDAYKLLQSFINNVTSHYVEVLIGIFVRYCENCPETMAASPWEKVLLWKYEKPGSQSEERIKDILDIGWLKVLMEYKNISRVCDAYSHLCKTISVPSKIFTYFTCSVITFLNERGERKTSFWVLKEVRRLKSDDAAIFISLVPTDKESAMSVLPELTELGQLVCELRVPLPTCTWDTLSTLMITFGNLTLGIDLLICAMQISYFRPDVNVLEKLLLECSRGDPTLLFPLSNLVCALSTESLTKLSPLLHYLVNLLAHGPVCAQQAKYNIIRHCQAHGINLLSHGGVIANIPQIKGGFYDSVTESQVLCQFEVHVEETSVAEFSGLSENPANQTAEISKKRNYGCQYVQDLKKRGLPVGCGYHCEGHKKRLLDKCLCFDKEIVMPTNNYTVYPDTYIRDNTSISLFHSRYRLMENRNSGSFGFPCLDMHNKDNIGSANLGFQDQLVSSSAFGYQDHLEPSLESVCQIQTLSLSDSQSDYQNLQMSTAYFQEQILLSGDSEGFAGEFGTQKRSNQCKSYLEDKRHGQTVRKGECNEEREECTQPYHSQSSIYSQMDSQTNYFEPMLESSQIYRGSPRQGSLFGEVPLSHLSVSSESLARASCSHDNSYEKGSDVSIALRHNSIQNLPDETRNNAQFFKHTQSQMCLSNKLAKGFDPQEKALHSSTNNIRLRDMNNGKTGVNNGPEEQSKKHLSLSTINQKQPSCQAYQYYHVKKGVTTPFKKFCTEAKTDQINQIESKTKINSKGQKRSDSTKGMNVVKTNETGEISPKSPSFTDDYDEHLSSSEEKLSQLTENTNEHQSLRCFLPEITHCNGTLKTSNKNSAKATLSAISTLQGSASSSSLEYIIIDVEGCSFSPKSPRTSNPEPEVALARSTVSQNKRRTWQQQQNLGNTYQRKRVTRLEEIRSHSILGLSSHYKKSELKFRDFPSMNIDSRNKLQEDNSRTTNKMPQHTGNVTERTCISMPYQGQGESAATRLNATCSHNPANVTVQGSIALRKLNDLFEYDKGTAYLNEMKGTVGSTTGYNGRERRRLHLNVIRKRKRIRFKPWKGSKRPLLHHNFHN